MNVNDNTLDLSKYRGEVKLCPLCGTRTPSAVLESLTSGKSCTLCFGKQFVAMCTNCNGTGSYKGRTVWDGGQGEHTSVCTPCGGSGMFPVKKPANWVDTPTPEVVETQAPVVS